MPLYQFDGAFPVIHPTAFVHPEAVVIGDVEIGPLSSIWPMVVIRGDVNRIRIGARSSIQDGSVLHVSRPSPANPEGAATLLGDDIVVGHKVVLHGCRLEDCCMVGIGATILDHAVVGRAAMVAAGSLIPPRKQVAPGTLWMGSPAREIKALSEKEQQGILDTAQNYLRLAEKYREGRSG
ncbi:MAG: gamma carbonic anhydrase family protein [Magnetococcales bacterium]|nr:gamma carbonic anhydrase family protein [Magnetococcales bacterium]